MPRPFFLFLVLGAFAAACQLIAGIERVAKEDPPEAAAPLPEAAPPPPPPPGADPCAHLVPPPRPTVAAVGSFATPGNDGGASHLCSQPLLFDGFKSRICPALDLISAVSLDNNQPPASCGAVSAALACRADPATVDRFVTPAIDSNECFPLPSDVTKPRSDAGASYTCP